MKLILDQLTKVIMKKYERDISTYSASFLQKIISHRISETGALNDDNYLEYIDKVPNEIDNILNALNISYSLFFRNTMDYAILERMIFPELFRLQEIKNDSIRIWSTSCAEGQEPYSLMILADELAQKQSKSNPVMLIATDISEIALKKASEGVYYASSLQNVKLLHLDNYFTKKDNAYMISDRLKNDVMFSEYDLLNGRTVSPPVGIFGGYDLISCCNVLIYYKPEIQKTILEKLYQSMNNHGYLMVDDSERSIVKQFSGFIQYSSLCNIFVKRAK